MAIVNGLCTLAQARASLNLSASDTANDTDIERYIEAATPLIEQVTGPILPRTQAYAFNGGKSAYVLPAAITAVTSVVVDGTTLAGTDYLADLASGIVYANGGTFSDGITNVTITATVGLPSIPPNIVLAARECVRELWQIGRQGNRPAFGNEPGDSAQISQGYVMSNRVRALCAPNVAMAGFA